MNDGPTEASIYHVHDVLEDKVDFPCHRYLLSARGTGTSELHSHTLRESLLFILVFIYANFMNCNVHGL